MVSNLGEPVGCRGRRGEGRHPAATDDGLTGSSGTAGTPSRECLRRFAKLDNNGPRRGGHAVVGARVTSSGSAVSPDPARMNRDTPHRRGMRLGGVASLPNKANGLSDGRARAVARDNVEGI
jgi:hypothetical protein